MTEAVPERLRPPLRIEPWDQQQNRVPVENGRRGKAMDRQDYSAQAASSDYPTLRRVAVYRVPSGPSGPRHQAGDVHLGNRV